MPKGLSYDELFPGRFLKASLFKGVDRTLTIRDVKVEEIEGDKKETKGIVEFAETKRELALNRTNGECLKAMFGTKVDNWLGKRVTLYPMPMKDPFSGENIEAIRVRGSPDMKAPITFSLRLARKKAFNVKLVVTGQAKGAAAAKPPEPAQAPEPQPEPSPVPTPEELQTIRERENAQSGDPFP